MNPLKKICYENLFYRLLNEVLQKSVKNDTFLLMCKNYHKSKKYIKDLVALLQIFKRHT